MVIRLFKDIENQANWLPQDKNANIMIKSYVYIQDGIGMYRENTKW